MPDLNPLHVPANDLESDDAYSVLDRPPTAMIRESLNSRYDSALAAVEARTCHSWKVALDRSKVLIGTPSLGGTLTPQIVIRSAEGCRVTDIDGNVYIDLCMGFGANLLGHAPEVVQQAITAQTRNGWNFGLSGDAQLELAGLVQAAGPANERVLFCASGSEATAIAVRAARAHTGKDVIGVFDGSYHGVHDGALVTTDPSNPAQTAHVGLGIPSALDATVQPLAYGSSAALDSIKDNKDSLAAIVVEPVQSSSPDLSNGAWLKQLVATCREHGVLVIFDEVMTGFRLAYGGGQELFGIAPDLVTYGKALAGGLPVGAIAGRSDVMKVFTPGSNRPAVFAGSAFAGNPLSVAAGVATLTHLRDNRNDLYASLAVYGETLGDRINTYWSEKQIPLHLMQAGSILKLVQKSRTGQEPDDDLSFAAAMDAFFVHLLDRGITLHASRSIYLSAAHLSEDIDAIISGLIGASEECAADGLLRKIQ